MIETLEYLKMGLDKLEEYPNALNEIQASLDKLMDYQSKIDSVILSAGLIEHAKNIIDTAKRLSVEADSY